MPRRILQEDIEKELQSKGCQLIGKYTNTKTLIIIKSRCGHNRKTRFSAWRKWKQYDCKDCTCGGDVYRYTIAERTKRNTMHPRAFQKTIKTMEKQLKRIQKYKEDFVPENINQTFVCIICEIEKPRYLFQNHSCKKNGKDSRCKICCLILARNRRNNVTTIQYIKNLLGTSRQNTRARNKRGRNLQHTITLQDILDLKNKQNNKCAYSNQILVWKQNNECSASIDRIDSNVGYVLGNIQLVTKEINAMKSDMTHSHFMTLCKLVAEK